MHSNSQYLIGMAGVFVAAVLWGTTGTAATFAPELGPLAIGAVAMGIGGLLQALIAIKKIKNDWKIISANWNYLVIGALAVVIYPLAFYASMHLAGVAVGTVISIGSAPLFSAIIELKLDKQPLSRQWGIGALAGIIGMVLLSIAESTSNHQSGGEYALIGIILGILAGITYALYSWSARKLMQQGVNSKAAMGVTFGVGGALLIPVLIMTGAPLLDSWTNAGVGIYMALVPMFIGYVCYGIGLARIKASTAITITLIEPVIAALLAVTLIGEQLLVMGWVGIGLIILCLIIITLPAGFFYKFGRRPTTSHESV
ncbi:DMT family transporter [Providencia burhodogranariea]|uniref:Transporter n=1 Tax=Providencia burhodogranariea DSM 19968 TaxID=1141662 RepID=K8WSC5_9GAMM|nr:EamA family transporter [Providencia burhodogranariea]EKT63534.1 transporter [Providencia burhodogranariea DSM 19968]